MLFRSGVICLDPGVICLDPGVICLDPGVICLDSGVICLDPGVICLDPKLFVWIRALFVWIRSYLSGCGRYLSGSGRYWLRIQICGAQWSPGAQYSWAVNFWRILTPGPLTPRRSVLRINISILNYLPSCFLLKYQSFSYAFLERYAPYNPLCTHYSVMQSDRNSSKTDTFHEPTTYEPQVETSSG